MNPIKNIVIGTTLYLIAYIVFSTIEQAPDQLIIGMFSLSLFIVVYMVLRVLTTGVPSSITFDKSFYEDAGTRVNID